MTRRMFVAFALGVLLVSVGGSARAITAVALGEMITGVALVLLAAAARRERLAAKAYADEAACCERLARVAVEQAAEINKSAWRAIGAAMDELEAAARPVPAAAQAAAARRALAGGFEELAKQEERGGQGGAC